MEPERKKLRVNAMMFTAGWLCTLKPAFQETRKVTSINLGGLPSIRRHSRCPHLSRLSASFCEAVSHPAQQSRKLRHSPEGLDSANPPLFLPKGQMTDGFLLIICTLVHLWETFCVWLRVGAQKMCQVKEGTKELSTVPSPNSSLSLPLPLPTVL